MKGSRIGEVSDCRHGRRSSCIGAQGRFILVELYSVMVKLDTIANAAVKGLVDPKERAG